jgi:hypothetical protein
LLLFLPHSFMRKNVKPISTIVGIFIVEPVNEELSFGSNGDRGVKGSGELR